MSIGYTEDPRSGTVELTVNGRVTRDDYDSVVDRLQQFIDAHGTIRLIEVIETFEGFDPSVLLPGLKFDMKNIRHISHVAVVSDIGWIGPLSKAAGALLTTRLRTFNLAELPEARAWITGDS
jgi:hypothetical protein